MREDSLNSLQNFSKAYPYPFMTFNKSGELQCVNPAGSYAFDIWPTQAGKFIEGFWANLVHEVLRSGGYKETEYKIKDKVFNLIFALSESGELVYVIGFDITDFRRDQEEKNQMEAELRQLQKSESLGRLAGGIAHDFNNILTPILGYAELARMGAKGNQLMEECVENIIKAANRAKDLVHKILTFSRQTKTDKKVLNIHEVIEEVVDLLKATIPKNIQIKTKLKECGNILADKTQIHQILMNLCTNAYQAIRPAKGIIEISVEEITVDINLAIEHPTLKEGEKYIKLSVKDNGKGMDKETLKHIFEPFFTTKPAEEGTGLGLSMVQGIVRNHEGEITVESTAGQGTVFYVYLPVIQNTNLAHDFMDSGLPKGNESILFVDDEEIITGMVGRLLSMLGYRVTQFTDTNEAVKTFEKNPGKFDLVITDQDMPSVTGLQLAREIMKIRPNVPIILLTGFKNKPLIERAKASGIETVIIKPINIKELATTVRKVLDS